MGLVLPREMPLHVSCVRRLKDGRGAAEGDAAAR